MFFELSKFVHFIVTSPISWMAALLVLSFSLKSRRRRGACLVGCLVLFTLSTNGVLFNAVSRAMTADVAQPTMRADRTYRVAVVLGGFSMVNPETGQLQFVEDRADRILVATRLWREGRVERILVSGDPATMARKGCSSTAGEFLAFMASATGVPPEAFILEQQACNTRQNAVNSVAILREAGIDAGDCVLITSATHMKRALGCFAREGYVPDYVAVGLPMKIARVNHRAFYPDWDVAVKWEELVNEWVGDVVYRLAGYI